MAKRDAGWTSIESGRLPADEQEVEFVLAGLGEEVLHGTFRADRRPYTEGIKWVFVARSPGGRPRAHRHGVIRWRAVRSAAKRAAS